MQHVTVLSEDPVLSRQKTGAVCVVLRLSTAQELA